MDSQVNTETEKSPEPPIKHPKVSLYRIKKTFPTSADLPLSAEQGLNVNKPGLVPLNFDNIRKRNKGKEGLNTLNSKSFQQMPITQRDGFRMNNFNLYQNTERAHEKPEDNNYGVQYNSEAMTHRIRTKRDGKPSFLSSLPHDLASVTWRQKLHKNIGASREGSINWKALEQGINLFANGHSVSDNITGSFAHNESSSNLPAIQSAKYLRDKSAISSKAIKDIFQKIRETDTELKMAQKQKPNVYKNAMFINSKNPVFNRKNNALLRKMKNLG